ncbi:MAG: hypothetical protein ACYCOR_20250 [Acidobacteriaceae bacterium]
MSKFKIDHSASRIRQAKIQASIDQSIVDDIQLMAEWSDNEPKYIINQLLRFALTQEEGFLKYKAGRPANPRISQGARSATAPSSPVSGPPSKSDSSSITHA